MLIYNRRGSITGSKIGDALGVRHGREMGWAGENISPEFLIRWGNSQNPAIDCDVEFVINNAEAIKQATNKLASLEILNDAGLNVPAWSTNPDELVEEFGFPIMGRKLRHARGTDIQLCLQERDYRRRRDFYTVYIPTKREYRAHVVGQNVVRVQGKYLDHPELKKAWIRNYHSGYRFRNPRLRLRSERLQAAIRAVSALNLDFGAVDLIIGDDNQTYILEVNTAPSCSPLTGAAYVHGIANMIPDGYALNIDLNHLDLLNPTDDEDTEDYDDEDVEEYMEESLTEFQEEMNAA